MLLAAGVYLVTAQAETTQAGVAATATASAPNLANSAQITFKEILLEVHLNQQRLTEVVQVRRRSDGGVLVRAQDLKRWRLLLPKAPIANLHNEDYVLLNSLPALTYRLDAATQSLWIDTIAANFENTDISQPRVGASSAIMSAPGGFLNYDLSAQRSQGINKLGTYVEFGAFARGWVGTTQILKQDLSAAGSFVRPESTISMDRPEQRSSIRLGDAISRSGSWGRAVRFGGIQWATNFSTQPEFITFPLPSFSGMAALPSSAELFVNNVRTYQSDIQPGPFALNQLPVVTGQGEAKLVVRDLLGREQVITQQFYAARSLLKPGVEDFSYEFGALRANFGVVSNDYKQLLFAGTQRHGFSDQFTGEVHVELAAARQTLGIAATTLLPRLGVIDTSVAGSHSDLGNGGLVAIGFERQSPGFSYGVKTQLSSRQFEQLGLAPGRLAALRQTNAHIGWNAAHIGSFGVGYIRFDNRNMPSSEVLSSSYSRNLMADLALGLFAYRSLQAYKDYAVGLVLTYALGNRTAASMTANSGSSSNDSLLLQLQQNLPAGNGLGYRVLADAEASGRREAGLSLQNDYGTYSVEVGRAREIDAYRASAKGGLALMGGRAYLARRLGDSFAVVNVANYPNVRVYAENQVVARTDASGSALVPVLRSYQKNRLRIEQLDLPLDVNIAALEIEAVPYYRSGYAVNFPVTKASGAQLRVVLRDGTALAAGKLVRIVGTDASFPVAVDGQVYLAGLKLNNRLRVVLSATQVCEFELTYPQTDDALPDLGNFTCVEIQP
jgi:outer membrane usher protein